MKVCLSKTIYSVREVYHSILYGGGGGSSSGGGNDEEAYIHGLKHACM